MFVIIAATVTPGWKIVVLHMELVRFGHLWIIWVQILYLSFVKVKCLHFPPQNGLSFSLHNSIVHWIKFARLSVQLIQMSVSVFVASFILLIFLSYFFYPSVCL